MTVRDVKPFVALGVVPYFMDSILIAETMDERKVEVTEAIEFLRRKWLREKGHGN